MQSSNFQFRLAILGAPCLLVLFFYMHQEWFIVRLIDVDLFMRDEGKVPQNVSVTSTPGLSFFFIPPATMEEVFPALAHCGITVFADQANTALARDPRRVLDIRKAKVVVVPTYGAWETNWPVYEGGESNMARQGDLCLDQLYKYGTMVSRMASLFGAINSTEHSGRPPLKVLIMDSLPSYDHLPREAYSDKRVMWAKLNMLSSHWRPQDISMPPPPHHNFIASNNSTRPSSGLPKRKYFLTFKGNLAAHPVRRQVEKYHNSAKGVIVVDSKAAGTDTYNFEDLMTNSTFTLALRGDVEFSYRFTEAVCSGAVPVLVADGWVPPFERLAPFDTYGVRVDEARLDSLLPTLRDMSDEVWRGMQQEAAHLCQSYMGSVEKAIHTMITLALQGQDDKE